MAILTYFDRLYPEAKHEYWDEKIKYAIKRGHTPTRGIISFDDGHVFCSRCNTTLAENEAGISYGAICPNCGAYLFIVC